ncbi:hypothetical protein [Actinopolyspora mortivallis]|uniref:hypothetical protein n=1 Tax=Actinopolyspora mortivallis TaxID=33906 RepID=UPI00036952BF|nr:hypothetical protein [Actinopolyspora mortivallis]
MPWPSESRCRFVVGVDSRIIHATGMQRRAECARAGRGLLACFCGVRIRLPQSPPQRIVPGWHHYCPVCTRYLIAATAHPSSPRQVYEPWLCELAALGGAVATREAEEEQCSFPSSQ